MATAIPTPTATQTSLLIDLTVDDLQVIQLDILDPDEPFSVQATVSNIGDVDISGQFFVDFYLNPSQTGPFLISESVAFKTIFGLAVGTQQTINVTIPGGMVQTVDNTLYVQVDSFNQINETNEANNETAVLNFDVLPRKEWFIYLPFIKK
ncbi:MAG: hypothetical protein DWQ04_29990 [Chloroflexi bacterium]|nr:MAG: hypothetical protein DWQ04_29990 [Chloroflexota bacterium]